VNDPESLLLSIFSSEGREDPHSALAELRRTDPVHHSPAFDGYFLTRYTDCQAVLTSSAFAVPDLAWCAREIPHWREHPAAEFFYTSMLRSNGPDHARLRRLVGSAFGARRVAALRPVVREITTELLDTFEAMAGTAGSRAGEAAGDAGAAGAEGVEGGTAIAARANDGTATRAGAGPGAGGGVAADFQALVGYPLPIAVASRLVGAPGGDQDLIRRLGQDAGRLLEPVRTQEDWRRADSAVAGLRAYFTDLVARRRREPADDLTSALLAVRDTDDGRLGARELVDTLALLLVAGFETTAGLPGLAVHALLTHRGQWELICKQPESAARAVEETLRWDAPVWMTERVALRPFDVGDTTLPAGANVTTLLAAGNRDPERHPHPDEFRIEREDIKVLSFGAGPHFCVGAALARMEAAEVVEQAARRMPDLRLAGRPVRRDSISLRAFETLPLATAAAG
jgi:cytochrome P450